MHQTPKSFQRDEVCDEVGVLRKSNLMARYYSELQGKESNRKTSERLKTEVETLLKK